MSGIRRIVASCGPDGRSRVERDETVAFFGSPAWPNQGAADLWATAGAISNAGPGAPNRDRPIPGPGGSAFFIMRCPPESELDAMPAEQRAAAMQSPADHVPGLIAADRSRHHTMHASDTLDYCVLLSGEVSAVLD